MTNDLERVSFRDFRRPGFPDLSPEEAQRLSDQNKITTYNSIVGEDDGTGIQCGLCKNKGVVAYLNKKSGHVTFRSCKCYARRLTVRRLQRCGIWERAQRCRLDAFQTVTPTQKALMKAARGFLDAPVGRWMALCGQSGSGKTHITVGTFCELVEHQGYEGDVLLWNSMSRALKAAVMEDDSHLYDRYKTAELLLVDDLFKNRGGECPSSADIRLAFEILDARYNSRLPTIISCELPFDRLTELDQAIAGRIREMCGPFMVNIEPDIKKNYRYSSVITV